MLVVRCFLRPSSPYVLYCLLIDLGRKRLRDTRTPAPTCGCAMSQPPHLTIVGHPKPSIICNTLLRALSADDLALLQPHLEVIESKRGDVVAEPNKPIQHVVFPEDAIISVVASTPD